MLLNKERGRKFFAYSFALLCFLLTFSVSFFCKGRDVCYLFNVCIALSVYLVYLIFSFFYNI